MLFRFLAVFWFFFSAFSSVSEEQHILIHNKTILSHSEWIELDEASIIPRTDATLTDWIAEQKLVNELDRYGGRYAQLFVVSNFTTNQRWVVDTEQHVVKDVTYYLYRSDGLAVIESGFGIVDEFFSSYARRLEIQPSEELKLLVVYSSPEYNQHPKLTIWDEDTFVASHMGNRFWVVLFIGVIFALCIFTFFIAVGLNEKTIYCYSLYLLALCLAWLGRYELFEFALFKQHYETIYTPFLLLPLLGGYFCVLFLQLDRYLPRLALILKFNGWVSFSVALISPWWFEYANVLCSSFVVVWVSAALTSGIIRYQHGYQSAKYYLLAFTWLSLPTVIMMPRNFGWVELNWVDIELLTLVGGALDAVFLGFALAHRETLNQKHVRKLQDADVSKTQFLANMSHEIRTPLTSIIGYADAILRKEVPSSEEATAIKTISQNGQFLLSLINNILDLSKIEANKLEFQSEFVDVPQLFQDIESMMKSQAADKEIDFSITFDFPIPRQIQTDSVRVKQVLVNIINNAIKFTERGSVKVGVSWEHDELVVAIQDSGVGMSELQQKQIFEPFYQAESDTHRRFGGTGLGLNIAKRFVDGMGGTLSVMSDLGKGSIFTVRLPVNHEVSLVNQIAYFNTPLEVVTIPTIKNDEFDTKNVLLAEDNHSNRKLIKLIMESHGVNVIEATNGMEAVEAVQNHDIALVLMDIQMPIMDGVEAFTIIKARGYLGPIIALTANTMKHEVERYMTVGFDAHLSKPLDRQRFSDVFKHYLSLSNDNQMQVSSNSIESLVAEYLGDIPVILNELVNALKHASTDEALSLVHQHKGSSGSYGFYEMSSCLAEVESLLRNDDRHGATILLERLIVYTERYTQLKGIDLAAAIVAFDNNVEDFLMHIEESIMHCKALLSQLMGPFDGPLNVQQIHQSVSELRYIADDNFMTGLFAILKRLEEVGSDIDNQNSQTVLLRQYTELADNLELIQREHWQPLS